MSLQGTVEEALRMSETERGIRDRIPSGGSSSRADVSSIAFLAEFEPDARLQNAVEKPCEATSRVSLPSWKIKHSVVLMCLSGCYWSPPGHDSLTANIIINSLRHNSWYIHWFNSCWTCFYRLWCLMVASQLQTLASELIMPTGKRGLLSHFL